MPVIQDAKQSPPFRMLAQNEGASRLPFSRWLGKLRGLGSGRGHQ
jgi:hypothetical protein